MALLHSASSTLMDIIGRQSGELAANQIKIDDSTLGKALSTLALNLPKSAKAEE